MMRNVFLLLCKSLHISQKPEGELNNLGLTREMFKKMSRAKRPCSVGGMGGKEERFNDRWEKLFLNL